MLDNFADIVDFEQGPIVTFQWPTEYEYTDFLDPYDMEGWA
jgi:hypothetical protein